jgi:hypothetical protein
MLISEMHSFQEIPEIERNGEIAIKVTVHTTGRRKRTLLSGSRKRTLLSGSRTSFSAVLVDLQSYVLQLETVSTNESLGGNPSLKPVSVQIKKGSEGGMNRVLLALQLVISLEYFQGFVEKFILKLFDLVRVSCTQLRHPTGSSVKV